MLLANPWPVMDILVCVGLTEPRGTLTTSEIIDSVKVSVPPLAGGGRSLAAAAALGQEHMDASERSHTTKLRRVWKAGE